MRRTVAAEMPATTPSATNVRAISAQSHWQSERSRSSGRSQAILTTCRATAGGENGPPARPRPVLQPVNPRGHEALGPLTHVPLGHAHMGGDMRIGLAAG